MDFKEFLNRKPLFYDKIDLDRMPKAFESIKNHLGRYRTVHIVGTNGKGSTGRILAELLKKEGFSVGHYTSPHILRFNERIWIDGTDISDEALQESHEKLMRWLSKETADALSYFEYTTLLALVAFEKCDIVVLEAGLGGEFDATAVVDMELSIFTPIGYDHQKFLGETIEEIAGTKLRVMSKIALIAPQRYKEALTIAKNISKQKGAKLYQVHEVLDEKSIKKICSASFKKGWPHFLGENCKVAFAAAKLLLRKDLPISFMENINLKGRFERVSKNIIIDVGHNPLSAKSISEALGSKKVVLIYNTLDDKDVANVLKILSSNIKRIEIIQIDDDRAIEYEKLSSIIKECGLKSCKFIGINSQEEYLVYGSFRVVEAFLKYYEAQDSYNHN